MIKHLIKLKSKYDGINVDLLQWFIVFLIKKTAVDTIKNGNMSNKELAEELYIPIIRKCKKIKAYLSFMDYIWGADLADVLVS